MADTPEMLRQRAIDAIRAQIVEGRFNFGERLSDRMLAAALGVSRTPVREALARLAAEGLVTIWPQSGSYVMAPDAMAVRAVFEMRSVLECGALRLASGNDPDQLATKLTPLIAGAALAVEAGDLRRAEQLDAAFHRALVAASGNPLLIQAYRGIADQIDAFRYRLPREVDRIAAALAGHRRILDLALADRLTTAEAELASHVRAVQGLAIALVAREEKSREDNHWPLSGRCHGG